MEISEPERAAARFQAVVSSLLAPGRGAQLFVHSPLEVRLQVGADTQRGVPVLAQVLLTRGDDAAGLKARLQPMLEGLLASRTGAPDQRFYLRIIVVTTPEEAPWVDATLRAVCEAAPAAPVLQAFQVSSDGQVRSASSLLFSEVGPALREQAKRPPQRMSEAEFTALCEQAIGQTQTHMGQLRELAEVVQQRRTPVTYVLLGLSVLLFALSYLWGSAGEVATLNRMGSTDAQHVLAGQWWRLLAATALHGGVMHIGVNSLGLWNLGRLLEPLLGSARFLTLYVVSGLCGSLFGTALGIVLPFGPSVGASGAICGLLAACAAVGLRPRGDLPAPVARNLKSMALLNLGTTAIVSLQPFVDWRAHLGGALAGAALIFCGLVRPTVRQEKPGAPRQLFDRVFAALWGVLFLLSIGTAIIKGQPWVLVHPEQRHRISVVGTPLSVEVPRALGNGHLGVRSEGSASWIFDDPYASPMELRVIVEPFTNPVAGKDPPQINWEPYIGAIQDAKNPFQVHELTLSGHPSVDFSRTLPSGVQNHLILQLRRDYVVSLMLLIAPGVPQRMIPKLQELLATFQDGPR